MFARSFLVLFGLVIIASMATAINFPQAVEILLHAYGWAKINCIHLAAHNCHMHWDNRQQLIMCGGRYLQSNKGQCMMG